MEKTPCKDCEHFVEYNLFGYANVCSLFWLKIKNPEIRHEECQLDNFDIPASKEYMR